MDSLNILITGSGAPGIKGTLYSLKNNWDLRNINTIGTDIKTETIGKYLCDKYYQIPKANTETYLPRLFQICKTENIDVIIPQNTAELLQLSQNISMFHNIGTEIVISNKSAITIANNKDKLNKYAAKLNIPYPESYLIHTKKELLQYASLLGWPKIPIVVKPPESNGMRGVRIIDENINLKNLYYQEKPSTLYTNMATLTNILGETFPDIIVMEYLPGDEYTIDLLRGKKTVAIPRLRNVISSGITFQGTVENNQSLIDYSCKLSEAIGLTTAFGFQFKLDKLGQPKLLESNPRIQGTMVLSTFAGANIIYGAVKQVLGEEVPDFKINWGTKIIRYWGGIGVFNEKIRGFL